MWQFPEVSFIFAVEFSFQHVDVRLIVILL